MKPEYSSHPWSLGALVLLAQLFLAVAASADGAATHNHCQTVHTLLQLLEAKQVPPPFGGFSGTTLEEVQQFLSGIKTDSFLVNGCGGDDYADVCPEEFHFSLMGQGVDMVLDFTTAANTGSAVLFKEKNSTAWKSAPVTRQTYSVPIKWFNPSGSGGAWTHTAHLNDLRVGATYDVQVATEGCATSKRLNISAMSTPIGPSSSLDLAVVGDMGVVPLGFLVVDGMLEGFASTSWPDAFLLAGDISYAGIAVNIPFLNITSDDEYEPIWDWFAQLLQPVCLSVPCMFTVGNHDMFYGGAAFSSRYHMPGPVSGGNGNFWYSYNAGPVHILSMSTEHPYAPGSPQWMWINHDLQLAQQNRTAAPWIMVVAHRPFYCSSTDEQSSHYPGSPMLSAFEEVFREAHVDVVLTGHIHLYERIHPTFNGSVVSTPVQAPSGEPLYRSPSAPLYLVVGTGGALQREKFVHPAPAWSAVRYANSLESFGYGRMKFANATHFHFQFQSVNTSASLDSFWLMKNQGLAKEGVVSQFVYRNTGWLAYAQLFQGRL